MDIILFVCTGNTCRSAMAEIYFNYIANSKENFRFYAESAGIMAEDYWKISEQAYKVLIENGIFVPESFHSTFLVRQDLKKSRYIFVMTQKHKEHILSHFPEFKDRIYLLSEIDDKEKDIIDPISMNTAFFKRIFLQIKYYIDKMIKILERDPEKGLEFLKKTKKVLTDKE